MTTDAKHALLVAFHIPPVQGSSGLQRTLSFANHLVQANWDVTILSVAPLAYERTSDHQMKDIDPRINVHRTFCVDAQRHLSLGGRYPRFLALPDRWASWAFTGFVHGYLLCKRTKPDVIWSTYPIATTHKLAHRLSRAMNIPHVADFRDQMVEDEYPRDPVQRLSFIKIERNVIAHARHSTFTAPGTLAMYLERYTQLTQANTSIIENGFDEAYFEGLECSSPNEVEILTLLHSGIVYPDERDPTALFDALARLRARNALAGLRVIFRASGSETLFREMLVARDLTDVVELAAPLPYREALAEMMQNKVLLVMQAGNCNHQIPAKIYEYLRAEQPIMALTPTHGDTGQLLSQAGCQYIADIDQMEQIEQVLVKLIADHKQKLLSHVASPDKASAWERKNRAVQLTAILDLVVS